MKVIQSTPVGLAVDRLGPRQRVLDGRRVLRRRDTHPPGLCGGSFLHSEKFRSRDLAGARGEGEPQTGPVCRTRDSAAPNTRAVAGNV